MTEKYEHCSTVPRTFAQDLNGFEVMQVFSELELQTTRSEKG